MSSDLINLMKFSEKLLIGTEYQLFLSEIPSLSYFRRYHESKFEENSNVELSSQPEATGNV